MLRFRTLIATILALALAPLPARAGPPYITDDPEPTDTRHWEIYNYASGSTEAGQNQTQFGVDANYGPVEDVQLTATLPLQTASGEPFGAGPVQLAVKVKLLHQHGGGWPLDVAIFPRVIFASAPGSGKSQLLLPLWVEHDWGKWSLFGGGGYTLSLGHDPRARNFWQQGAVLSRQWTPGFQAGLEYFGQSAASPGDHATHALNFGAQVHLHGPFSLIGSYGKGLNRPLTAYYAALKLDL